MLLNVKQGTLKKMKKELLKKINTHKVKKNEYGLSLMELVIAIGLVLILTVVGIIAFPTLTNNARESAVEAAASDVARGIMVKKASDRDGSFKSQDVVDEWMNNSAKKGKITVTTENSDSEQKVIVTAKYNGEDNVAVKKIPYDSINSGSDGGNNSGSEENNSNTPGSGNSNVSDDEIQGMSEVEKLTLHSAKVLKHRIEIGDDVFYKKTAPLSYWTDDESKESYTRFLKEVKDTYDRKDLSILDKYTSNSLTSQYPIEIMLNYKDQKDWSDKCLIGQLGEAKGLNVQETEDAFEHYGAAFYDMKNDKFISIRGVTQEQVNDPSFGGTCNAYIKGSFDMWKEYIDAFGGTKELAKYYYDAVNAS